MVASKTSFVIAAVALGAATSVYAAPVQYNGGADLAARGFEDEYFQLAARFFDDEFEARDFDDELEARDFDEEFEARDFNEEEYLFARDYPAPHSSTGSTSPSPSHSTSSSGSPGPKAFQAKVSPGSSGTGSKASTDHEHKCHHHHNGSPSRFATPQQKSGSPTGSDNHKLTSGSTGSTKDGTTSSAQKSLKQRDFDEEFEARDFDEEEYLFARDYPAPHSSTGSPSASPSHSASSSGSPGPKAFPAKVFAGNSGTGSKASTDHEHKCHHHHKDSPSRFATPQQKSGGPTGSDNHKLTSGSTGSTKDASAQKPLKQRDFDEAEYFFARDYPAPHSSTGSPSSSPSHSTPSSGSPGPKAFPAKVFAGNSGTGSKASTDHEHKCHHHHNGSPSRFATPGSTDHPTGSTKKTNNNDNKDGTTSSAQKSLKQRDFDEEDAVLLARSLGLDDDYFLEARSFDDDMYEY
ncbi:hypothetical protein M378DRAFT_180656 [Amanita muscaria Koide BX008]|uniref:Uncharacterized protein n=1 Tax=Amanita muscaria (strain Koide BX008) TaxID=946122 RepID=A0A0C2WT20_AMAMK|nr:hypothetical protein M378DRAFT_180656 [Amanita muscaria Koide BX008]